ncbi:hypothetical protein GCM10009630_42470 [Kribbella jejuensis]|uniref:hypothetical protein n=1 Tax=Kribbella jejuensis TaxID=236068 RepID=UPI00114EE8BB|nr:hypothetical protein [Kribbella jejuensis]
MKSPQVLLGVAVLGLVVVAIGLVVTDDPRAALWPMALAIANGAVLYKMARTPLRPTPWTRSRVIASALLFGSGGLAVVIALVWVLTVRSEWPIRIVAAIGILTVPTLGLWLIRVARAQDRAARLGDHGPAAE